jgi:pimeloyl-ACP methyl ester carboxylesterase
MHTYHHLCNVVGHSAGAEIAAYAGGTVPIDFLMTLAPAPAPGVETAYYDGGGDRGSWFRPVKFWMNLEERSAPHYQYAWDANIDRVMSLSHSQFWSNQKVGQLAAWGICTVPAVYYFYTSWAQRERCPRRPRSMP